MDPHDVVALGLLFVAALLETGYHIAAWRVARKRLRPAPRVLAPTPTLR